MAINKEKINKFVEAEEKLAASLLKEDILKEEGDEETSEETMSDIEREEILSDIADEPIENTDEDGLPALPEDEPIDGEETPEEEIAEYVDVTGFVDVSEDGDGFTVNKDVEVTLAAGNKIKFTVDEEEYMGTVDSVDEETGMATISVIEDEGEMGEENIDELPMEDEDLDGTGMEDIETPATEEEDEETIIEGLIHEAPLDQTEVVPTADAPAEQSMTPAGGEGGEAGGLDALTVGSGDMGTTGAVPEGEMGAAGADTGAPEMGGEVSLGSGASMSPSGGGDMGVGDTAGVGEEAGGEEMAPTMTNPAEGMADDVNQIISDLINDNSELDVLAGLQEADLVEGVKKTIKTQEPKDKVQASKQPGKKTIKVGENLGEEDLTKKVTDGGKEHVKPENITSKVGKGGDGHIKPEEPKDKVKGETEKTVKDKHATGKPVATMKVEAVKTKALELLAEKHLILQQDNEKLKFENYKLLKVNGLLTLGHELSPEVKVQLVEKFDKCTSSKQVFELYKKVTNVIKESRKPSLNTIITSKGSGMKTLNHLTESTDKNKDEHVKNEGPNAEERRALYLSGDKRYEDSYMK